MSARALLNITATVPAYPCGKPLDGRDRYGMFPAQARVYRWLVRNRPHHVTFKLDFREVGAALDTQHSRIHYCVTELVARGWLYTLENKAHTRFGFVRPIMHYPEPRDA